MHLETRRRSAEQGLSLKVLFSTLNLDTVEDRCPLDLHEVTHIYTTSTLSPVFVPNFCWALPLTTAIPRFPVLPIKATNSPTGRSPNVLTRP